MIHKGAGAGHIQSHMCGTTMVAVLLLMQPE